MDIEPSSTVISFNGVRKFYGSSKSAGGATLALDSFNLQIGRSEILSIVGPTGCGKSTAMNLLAGFETPSSGRVAVDGEVVTGPGPNRAVVFQQASLFPWLSVLDNVTLSQKCRGVPRSTYEPRARELLAEVGLTGFEKHYPYQLSGGMQQRVQIARALIVQPQVLLMDEPFGALDYQTRLLMQKLLLRLWEHFRPTILFITHDVGEAVFISDRVIVMSKRPGRVKREVHVAAPKPRDYEFLSSPEFVSLEHELLLAVQSEVEDRDAVPA
ncbi:MAG TPA: ABC transporter ATP-binding protein [Candidatus Elarobacter sp.]|jgi:NitT/TauT family transport system ATP-binding protein|nr:ABC transporter ATP-binding protein [Candidatus Elarobacter sp.]